MPASNDTQQTEQQVAFAISTLTATLPGLISLYQTITANRSGVKTIDELVADGKAQYQANIQQLNSES